MKKKVLKISKRKEKSLKESVFFFFALIALISVNMMCAINCIYFIFSHVDVCLDQRSFNEDDDAACDQFDDDDSFFSLEIYNIIIYWNIIKEF